jgi:hypothetical protein
MAIETVIGHLGAVAVRVGDARLPAS